jgi:endogenous inhibitor of DNA gyrase (YacG/DUF329 family)
MAKKRCDTCGGKFGMVVQRWYGMRFCRKRCRELYLDKLAQDRDRIRKWFGFISRASP